MNYNIEILNEKIRILLLSPKKNYYELLNIYKDLICMYYTLKYNKSNHILL